MNIVGQSGVVRPAPDPQATWTRRQPHPTPPSIAGVTGEVSRQQVACFFPAASHSWLGAAGSPRRQGVGIPTCTGFPAMAMAVLCFFLWGDFSETISEIQFNTI